MTRWLIKEDEGLDADGKPVRGLPHAASPDAAVRNDDMLAAIAGVSPSIANSTALVGTNAGDGSIRFVSSYRDLFRLEKTPTTPPRTAIPDVILQSTVNPAWFWVRLNIPDPFWRTQGFVTINPVTGNNENAGFGSSMGAADAVAIKSFAELNRRLPDTGYPGDLFIHVTDSIPDDQEDDMILTRLRVQSYDTKVIISCALTSAARPAVFSGTVSGYVAAAPTTNTKRQLTLSGAPSGMQGKFIQKSDGSKSAFLLADLGGGSYRISDPMTSSSSTGDLGTNVEFANAESVVVYDLATMPIYPFPATLFSRDLTSTPNGLTGNIVLSNTKLRSTSHDRVLLDLGGTSPKLVNCILQDPTITGSINAAWANVLITAGPTGLAFMAGVRGLTIYGLALLATQILFRFSDLVIQDYLDIQGNSFQTAFAHLHAQLGGCNITILAAPVGIFGSSQPVVAADQPSCSWALVGGGGLYGSGNTGAFLTPSRGGHYGLRPGSCFATTSAPGPIVIALSTGLAYFNFSDVPISLAMTQTAVDSI